MISGWQALILSRDDAKNLLRLLKCLEGVGLERIRQSLLRTKQGGLLGFSEDLKRTLREFIEHCDGPSGD